MKRYSLMSMAGWLRFSGPALVSVVGTSHAQTSAAPCAAKAPQKPPGHPGSESFAGAQLTGRSSQGRSTGRSLQGTISPAQSRWWRWQRSKQVLIKGAGVKPSAARDGAGRSLNGKEPRHGLIGATVIQEDDDGSQVPGND